MQISACSEPGLNVECSCNLTSDHQRLVFSLAPFLPLDDRQTNLGMTREGPVRLPFPFPSFLPRLSFLLLIPHTLLARRMIKSLVSASVSRFIQSGGLFSPLPRHRHSLDYLHKHGLNITRSGIYDSKFAWIKVKKICFFHFLPALAGEIALFPPDSH